jgi:Ca2+-binding RTX toxin-like protein
VRPGRRLRLWRLLPAMALLVLALGLIHGSTAANYVSPSRAGISYIPTTARDLAPYACSGLYLDVVQWSDGGRLRGTSTNDLLLGSAKNDRIEGDGGDDCLVGGGGKNDRLDGGPGYDVCIGNATARFDNCEVEVVQ